jgi:hypothetical protein
MRGEANVPRLTYLRGVLELTSPGRRHEGDKTKLTRLLLAYSSTWTWPSRGSGR